MAREPDVPLFKTASGSLTRRQILADFLQSIAKQQILPLRPSKVTTGVVFSCLIARLAKLVTNWNILLSHATPMYGSRGTQFLNIRLSRLSLPNRFPIF